MENKITKFLAYNKRVAVMCLDTTELVEEIRKIHDLTPTTTAVLGRVATVSSMMSHLNLKETSDNLTIQIKGNGPMGTIVSICELEDLRTANIKIYADNPKIELPLKQNGKIDVGGAVGNFGFLNVIRQNDITNAKYNGIIFAKSEQKPTALALGVLVDKNGVKRAGGYIINPLPDATDEDITKIEQAISNSKPISAMLDENMTLEQIAKTVTGDENIEVLKQDLRVQYKCNCSKDKFERGIRSLGKDEIKTILEEDGKIDTECNFCHKKYHFSKEELECFIGDSIQ